MHSVGIVVEVLGGRFLHSVGWVWVAKKDHRCREESVVHTFRLFIRLAFSRGHCSVQHSLLVRMLVQDVFLECAFNCLDRFTVFIEAKGFHWTTLLFRQGAIHTTCMMLFESVLPSLLALSPLLILRCFKVLDQRVNLRLKYSICSFRSEIGLLSQSLRRCICLGLGFSVAVVGVLAFCAFCALKALTRQTSCLAYLKVLCSGLLFSPTSCLGTSQSISVGVGSQFWWQRRYESLVALRGVLGLRLLVC